MQFAVSQDFPASGNNRKGWPWTMGPDNYLKNKNLPKISIITPSYNQGCFIEETIRSVLLQGYPNLEYIIIDGGSTDNTLEVIKKYQDFISYWVSEPDTGQSNAINKGITMSTGEIVAWLNSDDIYLNGALEKIGTFFLCHPYAGLVYGDCLTINEVNQKIEKIEAGNFNFNKLICEDFIPQPSAFIQRRVFNDIGLIDESLHYAMDYDLWFRIGLHYSILYIPEIFSQFRYHSKSKSIGSAKKFKDDIISIQEKLLNEALVNNYQKKLILIHLFWDFIIKTRNPSVRALKLILKNLIPKHLKEKYA
jgi:glycosyltransferase involved in cell wall biosynthesis